MAWRSVQIRVVDRPKVLHYTGVVLHPRPKSAGRSTRRLRSLRWVQRPAGIVGLALAATTAGCAADADCPMWAGAAAHGAGGCSDGANPVPIIAEQNPKRRANEPEQPPTEQSTVTRTGGGVPTGDGPEAPPAANDMPSTADRSPSPSEPAADADAGLEAQDDRDRSRRAAADSTTAPDHPRSETPPSRPRFVLGADISSVHEQDVTFIDTDGRAKTIFELLRNHGFNYIRVKTFVDPWAPHGYASTAGGCPGLAEPFSDRDHVIAFGRRIKAAGMGFLLNFHYSDVWADPGKQHIPAAWRDVASIEDLAAHVRAYTTDVLTMAIAAGARPDMVQIGNEITPGMLIHVPGPETDCWGNQPLAAPIGGSADNWDNLATLLQAGIEAVRDVDADIRIMLHIESTDDLAGASWWVDNALRHGLDFDVLGLSCYTAFQGDPSTWEATFRALAHSHPELAFAVAEYNPERTRANLIIRDLPDGRGLGTFLWEPTRGGPWGKALFTARGSTMVANPTDFEEFDALVPQLGLP